MSNDGFPSNIICSKCSNIKMVGVDFEYQNKKLENIVNIHSLCAFNQKENKELIHKMSLGDVFSSTCKNTINYESNTKCEYCIKTPIEYHCIECKRNICTNCFKYHKTHSYYYNKNYLSEKELEKIKNNLNKSKNIAKINYDNIEKHIKNFESQLNELKNLFEKYKDINNKLAIFSDYIFDKYIKLSKSEKTIPYPLYFNIKNVLLFNPHKLELPENDISIKSFKEILNSKLCSGYFFILTNSYFSHDLNDYNKFEQKTINFNMIDINQFNKKELLYDKMHYFGDDKIFGISYDLYTEVYNMKNNSIETLIKQSPENL